MDSQKINDFLNESLSITVSDGFSVTIVSETALMDQCFPFGKQSISTDSYLSQEFKSNLCLSHQVYQSKEVDLDHKIVDSLKLLRI
jgi:hypothetical protein